MEVWIFFNLRVNRDGGAIRKEGFIILVFRTDCYMWIYHQGSLILTHTDVKLSCHCDPKLCWMISSRSRLSVSALIPKGRGVKDNKNGLHCFPAWHSVLDLVCSISNDSRALLPTAPSGGWVVAKVGDRK